MFDLFSTDNSALFSGSTVGLAQSSVNFLLPRHDIALLSHITVLISNCYQKSPLSNVISLCQIWTNIMYSNYRRTRISTIFSMSNRSIGDGIFIVKYFTVWIISSERNIETLIFFRVGYYTKRSQWGNNSYSFTVLLHGKYYFENNILDIHKFGPKLG